MITVRTKEKDFRAFELERYGLENQLTFKQITETEFDSQLSELKERYEGRIFPEDTYIFDSLGDYQEFLSQFSFQEEFLKGLKHESAHGQTAEDLGYKVEYGCSFFIPNQRIRVEGPILRTINFAIRPFIQVKGSVKLEHAKMILEAPEDPSPRDKEMCSWFV